MNWPLEVCSSATSEGLLCLLFATHAFGKMPKTFFQQTFQKAFVHLQRFEGESAFSPWLTRGQNPIASA
jgi:hypothetical protein